MRDRVASRIAIDGEVEDEELLKEFLEDKKQKKLNSFIRKGRAFVNCEYVYIKCK